jgi:hypothetical protein
MDGMFIPAWAPYSGFKTEEKDSPSHTGWVSSLRSGWGLVSAPFLLMWHIDRAHLVQVIRDALSSNMQEPERQFDRYSMSI